MCISLSHTHITHVPAVVVEAAYAIRASMGPPLKVYPPPSCPWERGRRRRGGRGGEREEWGEGKDEQEGERRAK